MVYQKVQSQEHYNRTLFKAQLLDLLGLIVGEDTDLVSFDEVARRFRARQQVEKGIRVVPLDRIVGSVGRYRDFTKEFLPRSGVNRERWAQVEEAMLDLQGWPPIELYRIGDVYFVQDGNHRVSVARANNLDSIEAYVTEIDVPVALTVDDFTRDRWIIKAEYADFLADTGLDQLHPEHELLLTEPGRYPVILNHIQVHHYLKNRELAAAGRNEMLDWPQAVKSWYERVYRPVWEAVEKYGLLDQFPGRTPADLYLWITQHREELARRYELGPLSPQAAVATFAELYSEKPWIRALQSLKSSLHRLGGEQVPLGMSREAYLKYKERYTEFIAATDLDRLRPDNGLLLSDAEQYATLCHHIAVHRSLVDLELAHRGDPHRLSWPEAVMSWYDRIYLPVVEQVRRQGLQEHFPSRTETDLYLLIAAHREELALCFGLASLGPETAVVTFAQVHSDRPLARALKGLKYGLYRIWGDEKPLGMSAAEFDAYRARHAAGERTLSEAEGTSGTA